MMIKILRRAAVVLCATFGFVGVGILLGHLWLDRALDHSRSIKPVVQFSAAARSGDRGCSTPPRSMDDFTRALRSRPGNDLRRYSEEVFRCAENDGERLAFLIMLRKASVRGNTLAQRALEAIVRLSCNTIVASIGARGENETSAVATCVDLTMRTMVRASEGMAVRQRVFRIAQFLTLIEAEVATPEIQRRLCAEIEALPAASFDRLVALYPLLPSIIADACRLSGSTDGGVGE